MIKYNFALTGENKIVEISELNENKRQQYFSCISCSKQLIPKMGAVKQWHFAHKTADNCSPETYLHQLGKKIFIEEYTKCLNENIPFILELPKRIVCNSCKKDFFVECEGEEIFEDFILTKEFDIIEEERPDAGFKPDILLRSSRSGSKIYIEIAVTHDVDQEKIDSGEIIIEYHIKEESDIKIIQQKRIASSSDKIDLYNFNSKLRLYKNLYKTIFCNAIKSFYIVYSSGKSIILDIKLPEIKFKLQKSVIAYYEEIDPNESKYHAYIRETIGAYNNGVNIKNCFLCRYHTENIYGKPENGDYSIFCKFQKKGEFPTIAVECAYYRPDEKVFNDYLVNEPYIEEDYELEDNERNF